MFHAFYSSNNWTNTALLHTNKKIFLIYSSELNFLLNCVFLTSWCYDWNPKGQIGGWVRLLDFQIPNGPFVDKFKISVCAVF